MRWRNISDWWLLLAAIAAAVFTAIAVTNAIDILRAFPAY